MRKCVVVLRLARRAMMVVHWCAREETKERVRVFLDKLAMGTEVGAEAEFEDYAECRQIGAVDLSELVAIGAVEAHRSARVYIETLGVLLVSAHMRRPGYAGYPRSC